jgi:hypothetical protein
MVLLGRPKNGDIIRAQLRVKESKEFKVSAKRNETFKVVVMPSRDFYIRSSVSLMSFSDFNSVCEEHNKIENLLPTLK